MRRTAADTGYTGKLIALIDAECGLGAACNAISWTISSEVHTLAWRESGGRILTVKGNSTIAAGYWAVQATVNISLPKVRCHLS
ncbi:unnamed protein product [Nezara viridula]|uniref:Uncharacterized protein n=1 Tax=Nezara viridula TaxID=85310 RepID=A0A9P0HMW7_NEZVI|nr:unnamed protein product [Nezara viridula]